MRVSAQIASYTFSQSSAPVNPTNYQPLSWYAANGFITGGAGAITTLAATGPAYTSYTTSVGSPIAFPFAFPYNCKVYPNFLIYKAGFITLGYFGTSASTNVQGLTASTGCMAEGVIQALGGSTGGLTASTALGASTSLSYARVTGSAYGGDAMVVQFTGVSRNSTVTDDNLSFQIWMINTGEVKIIYGPCTTNSSAAATNMACGLRSLHFSDFNSRVVASGSSWTTSTAQTATSATSANSLGPTNAPENGLIYSWSPNSCTPAAYQAIPACMTFENTWQGTYQQLPSSTNWRSWPGRGMLQWYRDDEAVANTNWTVSTGGYTPTGANGTSRSARFKSNGNATGTAPARGWWGELDWYLDFSPCGAGNKTLSFYYNNATGNDSMLVYLSQDGGVTFSQIGKYTVSVGGWQSQSISLGPVISSTCIIRFRGYTGGATSDDIGLDEICVTTGGSAPTVTVSPTSPAYICAAGQGATSQTLTASGAGVGGTYSWSPTTGLSSGSGASVTATPTVTTIYTVTGVTSACATGVTTINVIVSPQYQLQGVANPSNLCSGGTSAVSVNDTMTGPQATPTGYCTSASSLHSAVSVCIDNVTFGAINNNTSGVCATGYNAYNGSVGTVVFAGTSVPISATPSANVTTIACYIDYNRNGIFETTEYTQVGASGTGGVAYNTNINIPFSATPGVTMMRLRSRLTSANTAWPSAACTLFNGGETEDYLIEIRKQPLVGASYTWSPTTYLASSTGKTNTASNVTSSVTYTVTLADPGGCSITATVPLTVAPLNCGVITANPAIVCPGGNTVLTANVSGGGQPYSYLWQGPNATGTATITLASGTSANTVTVTPSSAATYTLTVTDNCGNTCSTTLLVNIGTTPTISVSNPAGGAIQICGTNTNLVSMKASGAQTYAWSPAPTYTSASGDSVTSTVTTNTVYTVTGTNAAGCTTS
ncbi:MAG: hypothetical protein RL660_947, partial [Bacteroidota bacterium]